MRGQTWLILENGTAFRGEGFAAPAPYSDSIPTGGFTGIGEVVFNTAMIGYHEVLTDPSYTGQLVAMTYPHIGNYGISAQWNESGLALGFADVSAQGRLAGGRSADVSAQGRLAGERPVYAPPVDERPVKVAAFVLRSLYRGPVPQGRQRLEDYLLEHGIPGITNIDTRRLTLQLREQGSANALLMRSRAADLDPAELQSAVETLGRFPSMAGRNLLANVGVSRVGLSAVEVAESAHTSAKTRPEQAPEKAPTTAPHKKTPTSPRTNARLAFKLCNIALYDCGTKANILRSLRALGARITLYPSESGSEEILAGGHDAVMVSNGPGDPAVLQAQIDTIRELIGNIPVFGICLGHQLIACALGGEIYKMKFGHHGINQPVRDERSGRVFVTSQNHGFSVKEEGLNCEVWFRNANDKSIEGIRSDALNVLTTQFHPESAPGPHDSLWIFEEFLRAIPGQEAYTSPLPNSPKNAVKKTSEAPDSPSGANISQPPPSPAPKKTGSKTSRANKEAQ